LEKVNIPIQVGGGIRNFETAETLLSLGVDRIILGTSAIENFSLLEKLTKQFGDRIAVSLDAQGTMLCSNAWETPTNKSIFDIISALENINVKTVIYTDISKDGALAGANIELTNKLNSVTDINIIASGGVSSSDDLKALSACNIYGAIIGKALYEGLINLEDCRRDVEC
ncbi:1-(5-phosphoribosyl)-5-((5-phosphoribosylamino)methylideneamino)imidazole-4-carboxamide isomerase, partial [bacterium AH-315-G05]|nr:1-(5-phosphoribosyl)-5-((5-phosphoribosylamino)methylideneamino)imidazole-4-carboxamide isomerase [bacterium AH-315-G05]